MTNPNGRFGIHGGQYIPETLMNAVIELEEAYNNYKNDIRIVFSHRLSHIEPADRPYLDIKKGNVEFYFAPSSRLPVGEHIYFVRNLSARKITFDVLFYLVRIKLLVVAYCNIHLAPPPNKK
jgi:tryptophan synthase beta subunit